MKPTFIRTLAVLCAISLTAASCREPANQEGRRLLEEGQFQAAIDLLQPAVEQRPTDVELNTLYGAALLRNGQASLAVWPLRRAYKESGTTRPAGSLLVEALIHGGAVREGIALAGDILEEEPDNHLVLSLRAGAHAANLDRESALADIDRLIEVAPNNPRSLETRANLLTELDRLDEAEEAISQLRALLEEQEMPREAMARFCGAEGEFLRKHGKEAEAEAKFDACLEEYPGEPDIVAPALDFHNSVDQHERGVAMVVEQAATPEGKRKLRLQGFLAQILDADGRHEEAEAVLLAFAHEFPVPQPWLEVADHYIAVGKMSEAAGALERAIKIQGGLAPGEPGFAYLMLSEDTRFAYADILIQLENFSRVREILRHIEEPAHKLLIEARLKLAEGDPRGALEAYKEAFKLWPGNPGGRYLAGVAALRLAEFETASEMFQDSMRADPSATDAGLVLARMRFLAGQPLGAMETGGFFYRFNPGNLEVARMMLVSAGAAGLPTAAEGIRDKMIESGMAGHAVADYSTALQILVGQEEALAYLESVEELGEPSMAPGLGAMLRLMSGMGRGPEALERVKEACSQHPDSADMQLVLAWGLSQVGQDEEAARAAYAGAIELDPELAAARAAFALHLAAQGDIEGAVAGFDRAHELDPENPDYGFFAGEVLDDANETDRAEERLRAQLIDHPWHGESASRLARIALARGDSGPDTLILAKLGVEYARTSRAAALENLARVRLAREETSEARAALLESIRSGSPLPSSLLLMAQLLADEGNVSGARKLLDQSLESENFSEIEAARDLRSQLDSAEENKES
ncbi:MAG: tetratricopeptide repeat protein [Myxococcota bacterium]|nr:tetratricopeptide repeat protein [Myxococcota bacterium]